jgi:hypothetical protein
MANSDASVSDNRYQVAGYLYFRLGPSIPKKIRKKIDKKQAA